MSYLLTARENLSHKKTGYWDHHYYPRIEDRYRDLSISKKEAIELYLQLYREKTSFTMEDLIENKWRNDGEWRCNPNTSIYFLLENSTLRYIGSSENTPAVLSKHASLDGVYFFDSYATIPMYPFHPSIREYIKAVYIHEFKPFDNKRALITRGETGFLEVIENILHPIERYLHAREEQIRNSPVLFGTR